MKTVRLTMAQALVRWLAAQRIADGGGERPLFAGVFAIFGHGNVTCLGEALEAAQDVLPTWRGQNEQGMALAHTAAPDLVVCDIELPGMDGVEFARRLRGDPAIAKLPLLAVTSNAMTGDRERLIARGFDGYCAKPIDPQTFVPWMEAFLRRGSGQGAPVILVLDDVPVNLSLKRSCLEPMGWHVITASTPDEALAMARFNPPSMIISDVGMPEGDGFEFLSAVKAVPQLRDVPFIFITSTHWDDTCARRALIKTARLSSISRGSWCPATPSQLRKRRKGSAWVSRVTRVTPNTMAMRRSR